MFVNEDVERSEIAAKQGGAGGMIFDKNGVTRAAAEGLDADGAGTGKQIQENGVIDLRGREY